MGEDFINEFRTLKRFFVVFGTAAFIVLMLTVLSPIIHVLVTLYGGILVTVFLSGLARAVENKFNFSYKAELGARISLTGAHFRPVWLVIMFMTFIHVGVIY